MVQGDADGRWSVQMNLAIDTPRAETPAVRRAVALTT
jgi:hypothetical protein